MRHITLISTVALATVALAFGPHFVSATADGPSQEGSLKVSFREAGLGKSEDIRIVARASGEAVYGCVFEGEDPSVGSTQTVTGTVQNDKVFTPKGNLKGSIWIDPPAAPSMSCDSGETVKLVSMTYTDVRVIDMTHDLVKGVGGTYSRTLIP